MYDEPKFDEDALICPKCGCNNLHQEEVIVMFRDNEDSDGNTTICSPKKTLVIRETDAVLPGRRDSLKIIFSCEYCQDNRFVFNVTQHKGTTFCGWSDK